MPVDVNLPKKGILYQREQYLKAGVGRWYWDYRDNKILDFIQNKKVILDIGCGEGILMEKIIKSFPDTKIFGIDPSPENVDICKKYDMDVIAGSVYELPLNDESVDCVLFIEVIEHLDTPELAFREIKRVLRKGGELILLFPNDSVFRLARILTFKFKEAFYDAGHIKQWSPATMVNALDKIGFDTSYKKNLPFCLWLTSLHCLIVAIKS